MVRKSKKSRNLDRWVRRNQGKHFCQCGCGEPIIIRREHHRKSIGIPKFLPGHNAKSNNLYQEEPFEPPPKESVWDKLSPEERERRLGHLKSFGKGEENPSWKGGRRKDENGYIQVLVPEHPFANDGYVLEHRLVVEERTRKEDPKNPLLIKINGELFLRPESVVHHIDEVKDNNSSDNLMLLPNQSAHAFIHMSPLPMEERLRRISIGIFHSGPIDTEEE